MSTGIKPFAIVVAGDRRGGIGRAGGLPWPPLKKDSAFVRSLTIAAPEGKINALIMGRLTYLSIPSALRPLKGRISYVITSKPEEVKSDSLLLVVTPSLTAALQAASSNPNVSRIFIFGGARVYAEAVELPSCHMVYYTQVLRVFPCDTYFTTPTDGYELSENDVGEIITERGVTYQLLTYRRLGIVLDPTWIEKKISNDTATTAASGEEVKESKKSGLERKEETKEEKKEEVVKSLVATENLEELQYLNLVRDVLDNGVMRPDRTGVGTLSKFGAMCRYSLRDGRIPLLTTKRVFWRGVVEELLWMIKGRTNARELDEKKITVWNKNGTREFLDSIGLKDREEYDLGPMYLSPCSRFFNLFYMYGLWCVSISYGFQWRFFGTPYVDCHTDYKGKGVDQLAEIIELIKTAPTSRRILMSAWNPMDLKKMALPPCHVLVQFYVANGELSCILYQRSADLGLGLPFNVCSYSLLTHLLARICGLTPGEFCHMIGDVHIYRSHITPLREQLTRKPRSFPTLEFKRRISSIEDWKYEDLALNGYNPYPPLKMDMAV